MKFWVISLAGMAALLGGCIPNQDYAPPSDYPAPPQDDRRPPPPDRDDRYDSYARPDQDRGSYAPPSNPADIPPPWEARPVTPDARTIPDSDYVVAPGDTVRGIAARTGSASEAIARVNGLEPPYTIRVGQKLRIPGGRYHLVRQGETGIAIARAYRVPWSRIVDANELTEPYVLRAGQRILIPDGNAAAATTIDRDRAFELMIDDIVTGGEPARTADGRAARAEPKPTQLPNPTESYAEPPRLTGNFTWPVNGSIVKRFGTGASGERNDGIKIAVPLDTPVKAAADGTVAYTGDGVAGLGGLVILRHGNGWTTVYGHAAKVLVQRGQSVRKGQTIALSGDTGFADRPELHFEMRKGRTPVYSLGELPSR